MDRLQFSSATCHYTILCDKKCVRHTSNHMFIQGLTLKRHIEATLGSGNIREAVQLPPGEDLNEWLAVNTVDFYNAISVLFGTLEEFCTVKTCPVMSAGPKVMCPVLYVLMSIVTTLRSRIALVDNTCIGHMHLSQFVSEVLALLMDYLIHVCMEWTVTANIHIISRSRFILFSVQCTSIENVCYVLQYEYLWADGVKVKKPTRLSAPEYINNLFDWIESQASHTAGRHMCKLYEELEAPCFVHDVSKCGSVMKCNRCAALIKNVQECNMQNTLRLCLWL